MNKITKHSGAVPSGQFKKLTKYMFDDAFDIEEDFDQHSECHVKIGAEIDLQAAEEILDSFTEVQIKPEDLVGTWMIEGSRDYNNGFYWDNVDEIVKVEQVTETITVTTWKPICDENVKPCSKK